MGGRTRVLEGVRGWTRQLRLECLEDRRMLASLADVVFLVDNSQSDIAISKEWLKSVADQLDTTLRTEAIDVRYGVIAYGETYELDEAVRFAHSIAVDTDTSKSVFDRLFSEGVNPEDHVAGLEAAIQHLIDEERGGLEDGWDAIEHAIAEYDFRPGAVPVFVLVQNDEGRIVVNETLTRDGILAALNSKNAILNSLVVADSGALFQLSPYEATSNDFANIRILGVDASSSGNGHHIYHAFNTSTDSVPASLLPTESDALQISFNGSNTGASGMVASGKSVLFGKNIGGGVGQTAAGYRAKSVPFQPVDISTGATNMTPGTAIPSSAGFSFSFYGTTYNGSTASNSIFVNQDGAISFGAAFNNGSNVDLSFDSGSRPSIPIIAALWDDLEGTSLRRKLVDVDQDGSANDMVIEWSGLRYLNDNPPTNGITFQVVLFADGRIQINYQDLDTYSGLTSEEDPDNDVTSIRTGGISATVGIWSATADPIALPAGRFVPGPHSVFGAAADSVWIGESNDSYVRLAWDTGGAAWDVGIVESFGLESAEADALRDQFIESLVEQIKAAAAAGKVSRNDDVLYAINLGDGALAAEGFAADPFSGSSLTVPGTTAIDTTSDSIPEYGSPATKMVNVFRSAKVPTSLPPPATPVLNLDLSFTVAQFPALTDGRYIVELFFSDIASSVLEATNRVFDLNIEGKRMLNNYSIVDDRAKIVQFAGTPVVELDSVEAGRFTGVVKRFAVDVSNADGAGLQIRLNSESRRVLINGIRILRADAPRVENVVLRGTSWAKGVDYSYSEQVAAGNQLRPMHLQNANRIEVHFDGPVVMPANPHNALVILGNQRQPIASTISFVEYDAANHIAAWSLGSPLGAGKYRLQLSGVKGSGGLGLDGFWTNYDGPDAATHSPDNFTDDKPVRLLSGNGSAGTIFEFFFSVLPGDYNQDGIVTSADAVQATVKDGDGDGIVENGVNGEDTAIASGNVNTQLPLRKNMGDYNDVDDAVTTADYVIWYSTFGNTGDPPADGNGNGTVGAADYVVWRNNILVYSAWYTGPVPPPMSAIYVDFGNAPRVTNVTISGSNSTHDPYSFDAHDGSGEQLVTVPVGGADTISITFSEDVNVVASYLRLTGLRTANVPTIAEFVYDIGTMTATWRFEGWVPADHYLISLSDAVTDVEGNRLDGEWVNPATYTTTNSAVSEFPSGDGDAGGDFNFIATLLPGDLNGDLVVNGTDFGIFMGHFGGTLIGAVFANGDFNGDGGVTYEDYELLAAYYGQNLQNVWVLADLNEDGVVDELDVETLADNFGMSSAAWADGDLDGDGDVDADDLDLIFAQYGLAMILVG